MNVPGSLVVKFREGIYFDFYSHIELKCDTCSVIFWSFFEKLMQSKSLNFSVQLSFFDAIAV